MKLRISDNAKSDHRLLVRISIFHHNYRDSLFNIRMN